MPPLFMEERNLTSKNVPNCSRVLKSKENIPKLKCNKLLKKKLKKYKLRKDGQEDPDVIDVSQALTTALRIKSPNNQNIYPLKVCEENRSYNYLTKMVRIKKDVLVTESTSTNFQRSDSDTKDESISLTPKTDQDKKQTNAFKLLMDSRNKSIGSNSPGKHKCEEDYEAEDMIKKKELKAKRIFSLNRMAQAKGSLKKMEIEEYREEHIKRKLKDRARRFKDMIGDMDEKNVKKDKILPYNDKSDKKLDKSISPQISKDRDAISNETSVIKMFDLFKDLKENKNSNVCKNISKEDEEFLNKLSPSIRKKENMLCYFQKVSKDSDISQIDDDTRSQDSEKCVIKVKLKSKKKPKTKKSKNSTEKDIISTEHLEDVNQEVQCNGFDSIDSVKKRKRNENKESSKEKIVNNNLNGAIDNDSRPKRISKKPVKYTDNFQLTSSDEELHIFTPKKKRKDKLTHEDNLGKVIDVTDYSVTDTVLKTKKKKGSHIKKKSLKISSEEHSIILPKKATKLAPIFVTKPQLDPAAIEAKQKFLQSGVPVQLKKTSVHQTIILASDEFPTVVHIQNLTYLNTPTISNIPNMFHMNYVEDIQLREEKEPFKKLLDIAVLQKYRMPKFERSVDQVLQDIKKSYPKFPVYRTYHLLRGKSKGEFKDCIYPDLDNSVEILNNVVDVNNIQPDKLNWVEKYKPATEKQVIGNFESIKELRRWLVSWTENNAKSKRNSCGSDSSDFYQSDTDSREAMKNVNNLLIITGKVGTGKTLSVYAVAAELSIKVIEVNASTKRTGKIILQDLQEATQSHKVDRGKNCTDGSQKSQEDSKSNNSIKAMKKRGRKKKVTLNSVTKAAITKKKSTDLTVSQDSVRTGMSLILIDDADIVFDQDDGFCYAISQLIQSSKRPVILVTSSLTCPHLQKFSSLAKIIKMRPFIPRMLGTWLDIMCLVDNNTCEPGLGAKVLDLFKGDIRKSINYLQFYMTSHKFMSNIDDLGAYQGEEISKLIADDENSCMSWGENEGWGEKNIGLHYSSDIYKYFVTKECQLSHFLGPLNNFYVWWNLPNNLKYSLECCDRTNENRNINNKKHESKELNKIYTVLDNLSLTDCLGIHTEEPNIMSKPWQSFEKDSIIDNENFASYNRHIDCITEIERELIVKSIALAQRDMEIEHKTEMKFPSMSIQRDRDRVVARHKTLTSCLNPSTSLDRRALALDYWSSSRSICRTEKTKTDNNNKRNNRFCHYLKSLNIVCKNDYFDNLGESLSFKK